MKFYSRIRYKLLFGFMLVAVIPVAATGLYSMDVSGRSLLNQELNAQRQLVSGQQRSIDSFLSSAKGDIAFLSESAPLTHFLAVRRQNPSSTETVQAREAVEREFLAFAKSRGIYYQVRYLDEAGREIVRVDTDGKGQPALISQDRLQDQSGRYYFKDTAALPKGNTFVSPLDLNRERGKVEVPHKPVIRYGLPVQYLDGSQAGIVVTNIDAGSFLQNMSDVMLLDTDGYYLNHPDPAKRWGSKRDLNHGENFTKDFMADAADVMREPQGSVTKGADVITFQRVAVPGSDAQWILVLRQPRDKVLASVDQFRITFLEILAGALVTALILALILDTMITRPIEYLTLRAEKVSLGEDLSGEVQVADRGEIGLLAEAFERMRVSMVILMERVRKKSGSNI